MNAKGFTLVELIISIVISILLLGGIFYFMSDTILGISRTSAHAKFLKEFYSFTTILDSWDLSLVQDYASWSGNDIVLLKSFSWKSWIVIGVLDADRMRLSAVSQYGTYHDSILWYRSLSESEMLALAWDANLVYGYTFLQDKVFKNFNIKEFQVQMFNTDTVMEMLMEISPSYKAQLKGELWNTLPQDELFEYSLTF